MIDKVTDKHIFIYADRTFGEKLNTAIDFVRANWDVCVRFSLYLLLPLSIVHSLGVFDCLKNIFQFGHVTGSLVFTILMLFVSATVVVALVLSLVKKHDEVGAAGLSSLTFREMFPVLLKVYGRVLAGSLVLILLVLLFFFVLIVTYLIASELGALMTLALFLLMSFLPLVYTNMAVMYVIEGCSFGKALKRTWQHTVSSFGETIVLGMALVIICTALYGIGNFPFMIAAFFGEQFILSAMDSSSYMKVVLDVGMYLYSVLNCFYLYLVMSLFVLTVVYHYGSVAARNDDVLVGQGIENFDKL